MRKELVGRVREELAAMDEEEQSGSMLLCEI